MRHFAGVLLGIVLLPVFFALNWLVNLADAKAATANRWWLLAALGAYALVGLVAGICLAWRKLSPTALLLGGVLILAVEVLLNLPVLAGMQVDVPQLYAHLPITGGRLLVAVGVALFFGGLLPTRWHRPVPRDTGAEDAVGPAHGDGDYDHDDSAYTTELLGRPAGYETWGSGRNEYAEEPEESYTAALPAAGGPGDQRSGGADADRAYGVDAYDDRTGYGPTAPTGTTGTDDRTGYGTDDRSGAGAGADPTRPTPIAAHQPLPAQPVGSAPDEPTQRVESPAAAAPPAQAPVQQQPVQQAPVQQPPQVPAVPPAEPTQQLPAQQPAAPGAGRPDDGFGGSTFSGSPGTGYAGSGHTEPAYTEPAYAEPDDGPTRPDEQFENGGHTSNR